MRAFLTFIMSGMLFLTSSSCNAADKKVPDGLYNCHKLSGGQLINLGDLEIKGMTYRFDPKDKFEPFTIDAQNNITWTKGVPIMPDGWKVGVSTYKGLTKQGFPMIVINYTSGSGAQDVIDCVKEK